MPGSAGTTVSTGARSPQPGITTKADTAACLGPAPSRCKPRKMSSCGRALVGPVAELLHSLTRFGPVLGDVRAVSRECLQDLGRHPPAASRRRHHGAADLALPVAENVYKGAAIEGQRYRPPQFGIVEWRLAAVDKQVPWNVRGDHCALLPWCL